MDPCLPLPCNAWVSHGIPCVYRSDSAPTDFKRNVKPLRKRWIGRRREARQSDIHIYLIV